MLRKIALTGCLLLGLTTSGILLAKTESIASAVVAASAVQAADTANGYPVKLADDELFVVQTSPIASLSVQNRAKLITENIKSFADSHADDKALKIKSMPDGVAIGNDELILLLITEQDAEAANQTATTLATNILERLHLLIDVYRSKHSWKTYTIGATLTVLSILGLWLALYWNNRAFTWLKSRVSGMHEHWENGLKIKGVEVLSAIRIERLVQFILKSLRLFSILLCWYFFLPLILSFFPETRKLGFQIFDYLLTPFTTIFSTVIKYIPNLFYIFVIGMIAYYAIKLIAFIFGLIERGELHLDWFHDDWAVPTFQIVRFLVIVTALISAYPYIPGSSSEAFQGVGLVLGAIISFASSSAISNIVAGVILTYTRAFRLNDRIKVGDTIGDVVEKTLLVTRIKTIKHVVVTIPNSLVMGAQIINYSTSAAKGAGVILHTSITIGYDVPWQQVQKLMIAAAINTDKLLNDPPPFVLQTSLDDWYVSYEINAYTKEPEKMALIYSDLHRNIIEQFNDAGVEIMSPHYMAMRDGNASTVPSVLGTAGYRTPAFQVEVAK